MTSQQFSLRWNNYPAYITGAFDSLRYEEDLVDVTLCCEGRKIRAHKVLLSACSSYFKEIFKENPCQHPVVIFKNVKYGDLMAVVEFMYHGQVSVAQESLPSFLNTAELLSIRGLTDNTADGRQPQPQQSQPQQIPTNQPATMALAQQLIPTQGASIIDASGLTGEPVFLTIPTNSALLQQAPGKLQLQGIQASPQVFNKLILNSTPTEMRTITTPTNMGKVKQGSPIAKMQMQAPQYITQQQQPLLVQQQPTTLQEAVENAVQPPKMIKPKQITSMDKSKTTITVSTSTAVGNGNENEMYETETYHITEADTEEHQPHATEEYVETAGPTEASVKMDLGAYEMQTEEAGQEDSYEIMGDEDKTGSGEELTQDDMEMDATDIDLSRTFVAKPAASNAVQTDATGGNTSGGHEQKALHTCPECNRKFCSMNAMKRHRLAKHNEQKLTYTCMTCEATFKTKWSLSTHKSKYHRDQPGTVKVEPSTDGSVDHKPNLRKSTVVQ